MQVHSIQRRLILQLSNIVSVDSPSSLSHFIAGLRASASLAIGYVPMAFSFGVVALQANLAPWQAMAISIIVFAGAAQFVLVSLLAAGTGGLTALTAVLLLNVRHVFYGPALAAQLTRKPGRWSPLLAFGLTSALSEATRLASGAWVCLWLLGRGHRLGCHAGCRAGRWRWNGGAGPQFRTTGPVHRLARASLSARTLAGNWRQCRANWPVTALVARACGDDHRDDRRRADPALGGC